MEFSSSKNYNNLSEGKRLALKKLASDDTIVIKPSDKCGSIVVMNKSDYEDACLNLLNDPTFYEELDHDPNEDYKEVIAKEVEQLYQQGHITDFQKSTLLQGDQTPNLYGLPKTHSQYTNFPPLRPISNGHSSCTAKLSEYLDSFLKNAAQKTSSYVRDTTDFINKIRNLDFSSSDEPIILCSMDVNALYPNIDQQEGADACEYLLNKRKNKSLPSRTIKSLILIVLRSHTMNFLNRFFHQIKGTAMGTPMAVNFANLFMSKLEEEMLSKYRTEFGSGPVIWLRYIDDVFLIWKGSQQCLEHFLNFCNEYSRKNSMASNITYKYSFSEKSVNFLDVTVFLDKDKRIQTDLYSKPTSAHQYLHNSSYHVPHIKASLPKSQFMRIRRICSKIGDYKKNSQVFINFFTNRGYKRQNITSIANEVGQMNREELLASKQGSSQKENQQRVVLVITWSHKFGQIPKIIHHHYDQLIKQFPNFKQTFPEPPIVAYRRTKNIRDYVVRANHWKKNEENTTSKQKSRKPHPTKIDHLMNNTNSITNMKTGHKFNVKAGHPNDTNVIYAAECTKHNLLYTGTTGGKLSTRFSGHRSDIIHHSDRCELPKHFKESGCDFQKDLKITVLEKVKGNVGVRLLKESQWMTRLQTVTPSGLNANSSDFAAIYNNLFSP